MIPLHSAATAVVQRDNDSIEAFDEMDILMMIRALRWRWGDVWFEWFKRDIERIADHLETMPDRNPNDTVREVFKLAPPGVLAATRAHVAEQRGQWLD